ncbi:hypothetical protein [Tengunoibacter tsumagoiensis]|uniref:Uncharacterized protein n=1 Tax=Tengunoibacter tsumagoiensis TaxID=2014871 RepID=A0A402A3F3_9CHLR|nr:hypothetical protein [Tengunoibacter tsumagoiensis]GCE13566.1 hypothetical protein KTT_34250 [Tengunoibacter tsumagoiensis]
MKKKKKLQENDWLYACPHTMATRKIAEILSFQETSILELSAKNWDELWQVGNSIVDLYVPEEKIHYKQKDFVSWDQLVDWIDGVQGKDSQYQGNLIIIRECRDEVIKNLAKFIEVIYKQSILVLNQKRHLFPQARFAIVLAGWEYPYFRARASSSMAFDVHILSE